MLTLYVSRITDARDITRTLEASGRSWQLKEMSMSSEAQRQAFKDLKKQYDWAMLPLVVEGDSLIGGHQELQHYLATTKDNSASRMAQWLGLGGLIPFVALAIAMHWQPILAGIPITLALLAYAATILSFLGALQWGLAISGADRATTRYLISVIPSLLAWTILIMPSTFAAKALLFAATFAAWYATERFVSWSDYPVWFRQLRRLLTGIVCTTMLVSGLLAN
ncbi:MAG: DUF3429 domain-containing protein [Woeseiaceae bacterium]